VERGPAIGSPAPLFQLVYHDSLIVPHMLEKDADAWGVQEDNGTAWAALHGTMPYLDVEAGPEELARCRAVCELHRRVALQELLDHQIIGDGRRRRSIFADGTVVEADLDTGKFRIAN
jgi:hypothetical protein